MDPKVKQIISIVFGSDDNGDEEDYLSIEPPKSLSLKRKSSAKNDLSSDLSNLAAVAAKRSRKDSPVASECSSSSQSLDKMGGNSATTKINSESEDDNSEDKNTQNNNDSTESSPVLTNGDEGGAETTDESDRNKTKNEPKKKGKTVKRELNSRKMMSSGDASCGNNSGFKKLPNKDNAGSADEEETDGDLERHCTKKGTAKGSKIPKGKLTKHKLTASDGPSVSSFEDKKFLSKNDDQSSHESSDNEGSTVAIPKRKDRKKGVRKTGEIAQDESGTREMISSDSSDDAASDNGSSVSSVLLSRKTTDVKVSNDNSVKSTEDVGDSSKSHLSSSKAAIAETTAVIQSGSEAKSSGTLGSSSSDSDADSDGAAVERSASLNSKSVSNKKRLKESGNQIKEKVDTKKSKSSVESSTNPKITNRLVKLRRLAKTAGLFIISAMRGCRDDKEKLRKLEEFLASHGLEGSKLTLEYCKKFRIKREEQKELESLDRNNIVHSSGNGRPKRQHGFSLYRKGYLDSLNGGSSDVRDSRSHAQRASDSSGGSGSDEDTVKMPFSRLRDIIDSDRSSD